MRKVMAGVVNLDEEERLEAEGEQLEEQQRTQAQVLDQPSIDQPLTLTFAFEVNPRVTVLLDIFPVSPVFLSILAVLHLL